MLITATPVLMSIIESHGMNHVHSPTHRKGHILDVLITRDVDNILTSSVDVSDPGLCDKNGNPAGDHYALSL